MTLDPVRDDKGRWLSGHGSPNPNGRPQKETLDSVLRRKLDPERLADELIGIAFSKDHRDKQRAIEYAYNRLAGAPRIKVSVEDDTDPQLALWRVIGQRLLASSGEVVDGEVVPQEGQHGPESPGPT